MQSSIKAPAPTRRFRTHVFWTVVPIFLVIFILFGYFSLKMQESLTEKEFMKRGELIAINLANSAKLGVYSENRQLLNNAIKSALADTDVEFVFIYNDDNLLIASNLPDTDKRSLAPAHRIPTVNFNKTGQVKPTTRVISEHQHPVLEYSTPIIFPVSSLPDEEILGPLGIIREKMPPNRYETIGYLRLGMSLRSLEQTSVVMIKLWGGLILAIALFSALIIHLLTKRITEPINHLTIGAQRIAQGDLDKTIPVTSHDEIGQLAFTFNSMATSLRLNIQRKMELLHEVQSLNTTLEERINARTLELEERSIALEKASRHKSEFLANMSHELRTPLTAILGYSEMLEEDAIESCPQHFKADLKKIQSASRHLLSLINEVLDLSKIEAGQMELHFVYFEIKALIKEVLQTIEPLAKQNNNQLRTNYISSVGQMKCDPVRLRQCLENLLSNACKFTENGHVDLEIERIKIETTEYILFRIRDTGIGIPDDKIQHIFEAFRQLDSSSTRRFGGTGLGLAIAQQFCTMLNGELSATSTLGVGSLFTIKLPLNPSFYAPQFHPLKP